MSTRPKISVYIATSLDGFIARPDGDIDWLLRPDDEIEGEDYGYRAFWDSVDALVMGRHSYEKVLSFGGEWPYAGKLVIVLSSGQPAIPERLASQVEPMNLSPAEVVNQLSQRGFGHVYLDGGQTIQAFLREGFVDELTLTRLPVLLGAGISLFGQTQSDILLRHRQTRTFPNGFVQSIYQPVLSS